MPDGLTLAPHLLPFLLTESVYVVPEPVFVSPPVAITPPAPAVAAPLQPLPTAKPAFQNRHRVLVLYNYEGNVYLPPAEEELLKKILGAVSLQLDGVDLVNLNNVQKLDFLTLHRDKRLHQLLSFGVELSRLGLDIGLNLYQPERVEGVGVVLSETLSELINDASNGKKKKLWAALKVLFSHS